MLPPPQEEILNFSSLNQEKKQTILLIHGGFASHKEWSPILSYLSSYHLLLPDLPSHGTSTSSSISLSLPTCISLLVSLINTHAHNRSVHLIGFSFGGCVALSLTVSHPKLIRSVFVSGFHLDWSGKWKNAAMGLGLGLDVVLARYVPKGIYLGFRKRIGPPTTEEEYEAGAAAMAKVSGGQLAKEMGKWTEESWESVKIRTMLVVGSREPYPEEVAVKGRRLRKGNVESVAAKVEGDWAWHTWMQQKPELFANGLLAWIERKEMPGEYVVLP